MFRPIPRNARQARRGNGVQFKKENPLFVSDSVNRYFGPWKSAKVELLTRLYETVDWVSWPVVQFSYMLVLLYLVLTAKIVVRPDWIITSHFEAVISRIERSGSEWPHPGDLRIATRRIRGAAYHLERYSPRIGGKSLATKDLMRRKAAGLLELSERIALSSAKERKGLRLELRAYVENFATSNWSAMPDGLPEKTLKRRLIDFVREIGGALILAGMAIWIQSIFESTAATAVSWFLVALAVSLFIRYSKRHQLFKAGADFIREMPWPGKPTNANLGE